MINTYLVRAIHKNAIQAKLEQMRGIVDMCLDLSKEELIHSIKSLEKDLFILQRNAEIHNVLDSRLPNVKSALDKMRLELESRNSNKN